MAENKKSFVQYSDYLTIFQKLVKNDRENKTNNAGELSLLIYEYVNDLDPTPVNFIVEMAFEPIKLQLKRDLKSWDVVKEKRSIAGKASAEAKKTLKENQQNSTKSTCVDFVEQNSTKSTVNVNDNVTVNVTDNNNNIPEIKNFGDCDLEKNLFHAKVLKFESPTWMESVSMQQKISIEEIKIKIDEFVLFLQTTQTEHKIKKAFIEHFINWLTKKINSEKNGKQQYSSSSGKKQFRFSTADAIETIARSD